MGAARFSSRLIWLLLADAAILYCGVILAMYLRLGMAGSENELDNKNGWIKIAVVATVAAVGFFGTACVFRVPPAIAIAGWVKAKMIGSGREV